ncbi:unnamed protein product [Parajaminaea phylloscopi]
MGASHRHPAGSRESKGPGPVAYAETFLAAAYERLETHLKAQAHKPGLRGELARQLLTNGHWAHDAVTEELASRRDAIGGIDSMWLHLSHYDFNPVCAASYTLRGVPNDDELHQCYQALVDKFPKYRSKLSSTGRRFHGATFVPDKTFEMRNHVTTKELPAPAGPIELDNFIAEVESLPWDLDKPLWEATLIKNYRDDKGAKAALVMRGHHTLTDGQGFVMSQLSATSYGEELDKLLNDATKLIQDAKRGQATPSKLHKGLRPLDKWQNTLPLQVTMFVLFWTFFLASSVIEACFSVYQGAYMALMFLITFWRTPKVTASYSGPRVKAKEYATSQAFPIADVKKVQKAFSGAMPGGLRDKLQGGRKNRTVFGHLTLNDVLCTVLADVIGAELHQPRNALRHDASLLKRLSQTAIDASHSLLPRPVTLMIPISIREPGDWSMRNWSTGALAYLPNDGKLPVEPHALWKRLHGSRNALSILKHGLLPKLSFWLINVPTGQVPLLFPGPLWTPLQWLTKLILNATLTSFTAVLTNVPGPQTHDPVKIAGQDIVRWGASPPQAGKGTIGIGIISYQESVAVTICADDVEESHGVARRLSRAFEKRWAEYLRVANDVLQQDSE